MHWADEIAKSVIDSGKHKPYWVDDMKTPSGFAHVGSMMGPVIHSIIFRALKKHGVNTTYTFVMNDFDHIDGLSEELKESYEKYMGFPLKKAPSPDPNFESLGDFYADDFIKSIQSLGVEAEILSSWQMYHEGKFDHVIREALDSAEKIKDIYQNVSGSNKREKDWFPFHPICENCGRIATTRTFAWDGEKVSYICEPAQVTWAKGCSYEGKISPFGGTGKLPWKVDWAAHWKVIGVTVEGAGKDHASAGGSYDIAMELATEVFDYPKPYKIPYEFILIGGRKMSSSKGVGIKAHDLVKIVPPELGRFLFAKSNIRKQSNFDPSGTSAIPDLFDDYDKAANAFWGNGDEKFASVFEYSQINDIPEKHFLPRFSDVATYLQDAKTDIYQKFEEVKGEALNDFEKEVLEERIKYAKIWLSDYAPKEEVFIITNEIPKETKNFTDKQRHFLRGVEDMLHYNWEEIDGFQRSLYALSKEIGLPAKDAFSAIYLALLGKTHGPQAAWFLVENLEKAKKRFKEIQNGYA